MSRPPYPPPVRKSLWPSFQPSKPVTVMRRTSRKPSRPYPPSSPSSSSQESQLRQLISQHTCAIVSPWQRPIPFRAPAPQAHSPVPSVPMSRFVTAMAHNVSPMSRQCRTHGTLIKPIPKLNVSERLTLPRAPRSSSPQTGLSLIRHPSRLPNAYPLVDRAAASMLA